jgi:hypothetical protein
MGSLFQRFCFWFIFVFALGSIIYSGYTILTETEHLGLPDLISFAITLTQIEFDLVGFAAVYLLFLTTKRDEDFPHRKNFLYIGKLWIPASLASAVLSLAYLGSTPKQITLFQLSLAFLTVVVLLILATAIITKTD